MRLSVAWLMLLALVLTLMQRPMSIKAYNTRNLIRPPAVQSVLYNQPR